MNVHWRDGEQLPSMQSTPLLQDAIMDCNLAHRQMAESAMKNMALGVAGSRYKCALNHLVNFVWPNTFENLSMGSSNMNTSWADWLVRSHNKRGEVGCWEKPSMSAKIWCNPMEILEIPLQRKTLQSKQENRHSWVLRLTIWVHNTCIFQQSSIADLPQTALPYRPYLSLLFWNGHLLKPHPGSCNDLELHARGLIFTGHKGMVKTLGPVLINRFSSILSLFKIWRDQKGWIQFFS